MKNTQEMNGFLDAICILCGSEVASTGKKPHDRMDADIVACNECSHIQIYPPLSPEDEKKEYDKDAQFGRVMLTERLNFELVRSKFNYWNKEHANMYFDLLQEFDNVLDLGAGYGFLMEELNSRPNKMFNIEGIEIGKVRLDNFVGGVVHNINVLTDNIPKNLLNRYDCILCLHLLEHISKPVEFLEKIKPLLKFNGKVIFEVPNINNFLRELSPEYDDFTYMCQHCSYYSEKTLRLVFEKAGYHVEKIESREIYSVENHLHWLREGSPFIEYPQIYMPDERLEWINRIYKEELSKQGKGDALVIYAKPLIIELGS